MASSDCATEREAEARKRRENNRKRMARGGERGLTQKREGRGVGE